MPAVPAEYPRLVLLARTGLRWRWAGSRVAEGDLRLELFEAPCRACGAVFSVELRLPDELLQKYREQFGWFAKRSSVQIRVPDELRVPSLELVHCKAHRLPPGWGSRRRAAAPGGAELV